MAIVSFYNKYDPCIKKIDYKLRWTPKTSYLFRKERSSCRASKKSNICVHIVGEKSSKPPCWADLFQVDVHVKREIAHIHGESIVKLSDF